MSSREQNIRDLWQEGEVLADLLPIDFEATGVSWHEFGLNCCMCGGDIPADKIHGRLSRLIPSVVSMEVVGRCPHCNYLVPSGVIRFRSDGTTEWQQNGRWVKSMGRRVTTWRKTVNWIGDLFRKLGGFLR